MHQTNQSHLFKIHINDVVEQVKLSLLLPGIIESIACRQLIQQTAQNLGIIVSSQEVQECADGLRIQNQLTSAKATWNWLKQHYLSASDFQELAYTSVLSAKLAQHLFAENVGSYFAEHQLDYAQAVIYEVVLNDQDVAMELYYSLVENEVSFPEVARQYISDPDLRHCWGYRGRLRRSELKPEISTAVFKANPPQLLKPVLVSKKIHLILVEAILRPALDNTLSAEILNTLFANWLKHQVSQAQLVVETSTVPEPQPGSQSEILNT
jgi:parvulin-like peptidyl-prolyl isomerase